MVKLAGETIAEDVLDLSMAAVAAAMADPSRVKMLCALMDGRAWTATELSVAADVVPSTASAHLNRLVASNLVMVIAQGRHRYYRLAGPDVAELIEMMMGVSWNRVIPPTVSTPVSLRKARTCYDHLAGEVAVGIYDFLQQEKWITPEGSALTECGQQHFARLGLTPAQGQRRKLCCGCLDWSERRFHLGGALGAGLLQLCEAQGWLTRTPGYREVGITASGKLALKKHFRLDV